MTSLFATGAAIFFYFGFLRTSEPYTYNLRTGFVVMLLLTSVSGYFTWREWRSLQELTALIDPIPEISDMVYVPTFGEMHAFANLAAAVPGESRLGGASQAERQSFADGLSDNPTRYWILSSTTLTPDEAVAFYRDASHRSGWAIETDASPWIVLSRGSERLMLFVRKDWTETDVLYIYKPA